MTATVTIRVPELELPEGYDEIEYLVEFFTPKGCDTVLFSSLDTAVDCWLDSGREASTLRARAKGERYQSLTSRWNGKRWSDWS